MLTPVQTLIGVCSHLCKHEEKGMCKHDQIGMCSHLCKHEQIGVCSNLCKHEETGMVLTPVHTRGGDRHVPMPLQIHSNTS